MEINSGENASRQLDSGETIHLVRDPGSKWQIKQYDWWWVTGLVLWTATVYAEKLGWENLVSFEHQDDTYMFVDSQIKAGKVPGSAGHKSPCLTQANPVAPGRSTLAFRVGQTHPVKEVPPTLFRACGQGESGYACENDYDHFGLDRSSGSDNRAVGGTLRPIGCGRKHKNEPASLARQPPGSVPGIQQPKTSSSRARGQCRGTACSNVP